MDQTDIGLGAVVKALNDFVAPALDPNDHLAREQLRLSAEYIAFLRKRLDYLHGRERFDLRHQIGLAEALLAHDLSPIASSVELRRLTELCRPVLGDADALTSSVRAAALELGHAVSAVLSGSDVLPPETARSIHLAVLELSDRRIEFERHWYAPIGFEPTPLDEERLPDFLK
ncbi:hypothetical protein [Paracoccus sp. N5]|uniref:hypothetical protein n=1 Tax=Paracoccus sp. N5 TaxID=1101189 RepID=UPI0003746845|nr:hypothetical protein [Paracoccus sp. N5]